MTENLEAYLKPTAIIDSDDPGIRAKAKKLAAGAADEKEVLGRIYYFVRDFPYDILAAFGYLAEGKRGASDVLREGKAFCMGKASLFAALCRASGIPARIGFQQVHCPDKPFMNEEVARIWGDRKLPWHSLGEAHLNGKWLKLDATIDKDYAAAKGRTYSREYDGENDIPTVEGPVIKQLQSHADYPAEVADWYGEMAKEVIRAVEEERVSREVFTDEEMAGPEADKVSAPASG